MRYMKEIVRKNKIWVLVYLAIGLLNAFMANYKADYFSKDCRRSDRTNNNHFWNTVVRCSACYQLWNELSG